ncbi:C4-dicarboxylate ABC transporter [Pseudonocardia xishanensis]|uniref:C4-dicarboxylate transporter/malic acid transport protein n=1 Tax=Pseudonocardia xishanensis TaxID=630995 RepID=A0ABP8RUJ5_9PSEU
MTVGAGAVRFDVSLAAGWVLWGLGTVLGLVTAVWIPYMMIVHHRDAQPSGGWLMPVVPPMVSAANGALLVPHAPAVAQSAMLVACYAMFGISLFATLAILPQIWNRLVVHGPGPAATVPTMWIVLGPLGQSVTAAGLLGDRAGALPEPFASGARVFGLLYGVPTWGFAMLWLALAAAVTARTARRGLPFSLTWWSFTFPVGTCVTGTSVLFAHTGLGAFGLVAMVLYALLAAAWAVVAVRTVRWILSPPAAPLSRRWTGDARGR